MSYCRRCDRELIEDARYCSYCGASVGTTMEEYSVSSEDLIKKVKDLIHEGNVTRLVVRDERGQNLLEIPVTVGVIGALIAPWMAALGVVAALATRCTIVVERRED